jgi:hypothetical protein
MTTTSSSTLTRISNEDDRIQDDTERYLLITWTVVVLLSSLVGDGIILLGTIKYNAIKLNKMIVVVMQHLAVSDLLLAAFDVLPTMVALVADGWVLGEVLQNVQIHVKNTCYVATVLLNCAMAILKLIYLWRPFRATGWRTSSGNKLCAALWFLMMCIYMPIIVGSMLFIRHDIFFDFITYTSSYNMSTPHAPLWFNWYTLTFSSLLSFVPSLVLLFTSMLIIIVAQRSAARHGERMRREGSTTVLLTVAVFLVSFLPNGVTNLVWNFDQMRLSNTGRRALLRTTHFLTFFNVMANFYVYAFTVRSFRAFLKMKAIGLLFVFCPSTVPRLSSSWMHTSGNDCNSAYRYISVTSSRFRNGMKITGLRQHAARSSWSGYPSQMQTKSKWSCSSKTSAVDST